MNDRIQADPPRPNPPSNEDEHYAVNLRKPPNAMPGWVWVLIALPILGIALLFCAGMAAAILAVRIAPPPPPVTARVLPAPPADER